MANNIKGITIEIGGDTTKLDSALKSVDSKTRSLSQELKQINNQLKFDPHNAVLLQQKFDVLSDQVEKTREKLKTLEQAQEQVEKQFQNGEIDEGQYRAFQREIEKTKSQLDHFEKEASDAKTDLDNLGNEADQTGDDFTELGRDAQNSAKQVGSGFNTTAINMSSVMNIVSQIGNVIQSAIQGAVRLGQKIAGIVNEYFDKADEINTQSRKYGIDTDTLQKWNYAAELIDVSADTMGGSLGKLTSALKKYKNGNEETIQAFEDLGVSVKDASGHFRSTEDIFYDVIDALGKVEDETEADIFANQLFGRSFQELNPLIDAGSGAVKQLGQEAEDLGLIMSPEQLDNLNAAKDALDTVKAQLGLALLPIVEKLSPAIENIAKWLSEQLAKPEVQEALEKIGTAMTTILEAVGGALKDMVESGQLEDLINALIDALPAIADFVANTLPGLVDGLTNILGFFTDIGKPVEDFNSNIKIATKETETFSNKGQISAGLLKTAFTGGMPAIFKAVDENMAASGEDFDTFFNDATAQFGPLQGLAQTTFDLISGDISGAFGLDGDAWAGVTDFFGNLKDEFLDLPNKIGTWLSDIGTAISDAFKKIRMPKPTWYGGNLNKFPPELPSIKWYKEGGIFNSPSIIGVGEAGTEVVLPVEKLSGILKSAGLGGGGIVVNAPVQVVKELNDAEINRVGGKITSYVSREFARSAGGVL